MIIRHISDTHGLFPISTQPFDLTVHSGDIFPEQGHTIRENSAYQNNWFKSNKNEIIDNLQDKPLIYIHGNHDFAKYELIQSHIPNAIDLNNRFHKINDINFYGFPYVPWCGWDCNQLHDADMADKIREVANKLNENPAQIFLSHGPMKGILDNEIRKFGCVRLNDMFHYKVKVDNLPTHFLHGHIHESSGTQIVFFQDKKMFVSNAATSQHYIKI
jgi:Icc-related predicted phosphoesterase